MRYLIAILFLLCALDPAIGAKRSPSPECPHAGHATCSDGVDNDDDGVIDEAAPAASIVEDTNAAGQYRFHFKDGLKVVYTTATDANFYNSTRTSKSSLDFREGEIAVAGTVAAGTYNLHVGYSCPVAPCGIWVSVGTSNGRNPNNANAMALTTQQNPPQWYQIFKAGSTANFKAGTNTGGAFQIVHGGGSLSIFFKTTRNVWLECGYLTTSATPERSCPGQDPVAPPTLPDAFTRADGALGANWAGGYTNANDGAIVSNHVRPTAINSNTIQTWTGTVIDNDQSAQIRLHTWNTAASYIDAAILLRWGDPAPMTGYYVAASTPGLGNSTYIYRCSAGDCPLNYMNNTVVWAADDILKATIIGGTISIYKNGVLALSYTDPSPIASGKTGFGMYAADAVTDVEIDDFFTEDAVATPLAEAYYVRQGGSDSHSCTDAKTDDDAHAKQTINGGMSCLQSGEVVYIHAGTYDEHLWQWNDPPTNMPSGRGPADDERTRVFGYPGETVIIKHSQTSSMTGVINVLGDYMWFDNLTIDGTNMINGGDVFSTGQTQYTRLTNSVVRNGGAVTGIHGDNCSNGIGGDGPFLEVKNSRIHNNGVTDYNDPTTICANPASGPFNIPTGGYGIYYAGTDGLFEYNEIDHNGGFGLHQYSYGHTDRNNNVIRFNLFHHNHAGAVGAAIHGSAAIIIGTGNNNVAYGNIIYSEGWEAFSISNGTGNKFYNNTVYGTYSSGASIAIGGAAPVNSEFKNNIFVNTGSGNGEPVFSDFGTNTIYDNNLCFGSGGSETNCEITGQDPLFTNAAGNDFSLQAGSPAINQGADLSAVFTTDYAGNTRSLPFDIGAYEYLGIYYVDKNHGSASDSNACTSESAPCLTIAGGIGKLSSGDTLYVRQGTYAETFQSIVLPTGSSWNAGGFSTIKSYGTEVVTFLGSGNPFKIYDTGSYVKFDGTGAGNCETGHACGLVFNGNSDGYQTAITTTAASGPFWWEGVEIKNWGQNGALLGNNNNIFRHSYVHNGGCTDFDQAFYITSNGNEISHSEITGWSGTLQMYGGTSSNNILHSNWIHATSGGVNANIPGTEGGNCGGQVNQFRSWGIIVYAGSNSLIYNNIISDLRIGAGGALGGILYGSTATSPLIYNNTIYNNGIGVNAEKTGAGEELRNNIIYGNTGGNIVGTWATNDHNLTTDPLFVTPGSDFHLQAGSGAINQGTDLGSPYNVDKDNVTRPTGAAWDIGAYEQ